MNLNLQLDLRNLSNERLIDGLKKKVSEERQLLLEVLYALQEVETRRLHLQLGYPDLYTFTQKELGYSAGAAYRRVTAMKLLKSLPEVGIKIQSGELGLENASQAQSFFRKEDERRKSVGEEKLTLETKRGVVMELFEKSTREGLRILAEKSPEVMVPVEKTKPLHNDQTLVQFVASKELMDKIEELKGLLAHQNYEGRLDVLVEKLADLGLKVFRPKDSSKASPKALKETNQNQIEPSSPAQGMVLGPTPVIHVEKHAGIKVRCLPTQKRSRYIPAQERREVLKNRDLGCSYQDPKTKRICGSKYGLQFDHIQPFSQGGAHTQSNLRLLCGAHNRFRLFYG